MRATIKSLHLEFQSTLPSREETSTTQTEHYRFIFQSTLPSREETTIYVNGKRVTKISIHSSLAGRDLLAIMTARAVETISIHSSLAGRDNLDGKDGEQTDISIHSSLAGRDGHSRNRSAAR